MDDSHPYDDLKTPLRLLPGVREALIALRRAGHSLMLWSGRSSRPQPRSAHAPFYGDPGEPLRRAREDQMLAFVRSELAGLFDSIDDGSTGKPPADLFIDNRAVRLGDGLGGQTWRQIARYFGEAGQDTRPRYAEVASRLASMKWGMSIVRSTEAGPILRCYSPGPAGRRGLGPYARWLTIIAGQHGEEPAGVLALYRHGEEIFDAAEAAGVGLVVYPCVNPEGYDRDSRYNLAGERPTNTAVQYWTSGTITGRWTGEVLPDEEVFSTRPAVKMSRESAVLCADLAAGPTPYAVLDLHQDSALKAGEAFAYVFGDNRRTYASLMDACPSKPKADWTFSTASWSERPARLTTDEDGLCEFHDGSFPAWLWLRGANLAVTLETSLHEIALSVETSRSWILGMIDAVARGESARLASEPDRALASGHGSGLKDGT